MPVKFFITPTMGEDVVEALGFGEGLNILPPLAMEKINPTLKVGSGSALFFKTVGFFRRNGFEIYKIEDSVEITPLFPAYNSIIKEKEQIIAQIKQHLVSISTAIADVDLIKHDLRKYKEFVILLKNIKKGKELIKQGKIEEGEKIFKRADQSLRSIFIDQVDVHTGETVALKLIAPRWPTIISDFMKLSDEDKDPEQIKKKYDVSEAEGVVLATKNKLYLEWRDNLFGKAVEERFKELVKLVEMRKKSVEEYKNMCRPLVSRYLAIKEMTSPRVYTIPALKHSTQATMIDKTLMYAWKPILPKELAKESRVMFEHVNAGLPTNIIKGVGFFDEEIEFIKKELKKSTEKLSSEEVFFLENGRLESLPIEPSIDNVVRSGIKLIEKEYGVELNPLDIFKARLKLLQTLKQAIYQQTRETWPYSEYYVFLEIPIERVHGRLPNGAEVEDVTIELKAYLRTQNLIILQNLELIAIEKSADKFIKQMLGELGVSGEEIDEIIAKELGEEYKKFKIDVYRKHYLLHQKIRNTIRKFLATLGLTRYFPLSLTKIGPYEHHLSKYLGTYIIPEVINVFKRVVNMYKSFLGVPT
ncbi:MAG: hypothetical protein RMJ17_03900 [Candidatus Aenigmarchaeota archaeon]|nr:hypothetical protein [Candidatus Aenigmarchaeota archaeon]MDW8149704.1 hypothetical protein [Candidatus Aenigmarchaeota archaeon]